MNTIFSSIFLGQGGDIAGLFAFLINQMISKFMHSSRKEVVSSDMGYGKNLSEGEKVLVKKEIAKVKQINQLLKE